MEGALGLHGLGRAGHFGAGDCSEFQLVAVLFVAAEVAVHAGESIRAFFGGLELQRGCAASAGGGGEGFAGEFGERPGRAFEGGGAEGAREQERAEGGGEEEEETEFGHARRMGGLAGG